MISEQIEAERGRFEAYARQNYYWGDAEFVQDSRIVFPHYYVGMTFLAFNFWLAAKAGQMEVTEEMVERGTRANWSIVLSKMATEEDRDRHWQEIKSMNPDKVAYIRAEVQSVLIAALNPPPAGDDKGAKE